jgi:hypothetical protein
MNKIIEKMYEALCLKYRSEMAEAEATILIYFNNPVAIGEHPQHLEEMDKVIEKMANAKGKLEMLEVIYKYNIKREEKFEITEEMLNVLKEQKGEENGN